MRQAVLKPRAKARDEVGMDCEKAAGAGARREGDSGRGADGGVVLHKRSELLVSGGVRVGGWVRRASWRGGFRLCCKPDVAAIDLPPAS
jgi:hypothetical protein